jgi:hypothetical protein
VYDSTEVVQLTETLGGKLPSVISLQTLIDKAGLPFPLGYSQVLFAPCSVLDREDARKSLRLFLEICCEGWRQCVMDAELATTAIMIGRKSLGYPNEVPGVFDESSSDFQRKSLSRNLAYVAGSPSYTPESFLESHYIDSTRWQEASNAMASTGFVYGIVPFVKAVDTRVWSKPTPTTGTSSSVVEESACEVPCGLTLARKIRSEVSKRSTAFLAYNGRRVSATVSLLEYDITHYVLEETHEYFLELSLAYLLLFPLSPLTFCALVLYRVCGFYLHAAFYYSPSSL